MSIAVADARTVTEETLRGLLGLPETETLDYKRDAYGRSDADKREFCKDVSGLANTRGGDLVLGMEEKDHVGKQTGERIEERPQRMRVRSQQVDYSFQTIPRVSSLDVHRAQHCKRRTKPRSHDATPEICHAVASLHPIRGRKRDGKADSHPY